MAREKTEVGRCGTDCGSGFHPIPIGDGESLTISEQRGDMTDLVLLERSCWSLCRQSH